MSFGVDALGGLTEKLRQLVNDTQEKYESFIDDTQLFKQGKINEKEFFAKIGEYMVAFSALNFLAIRVMLELKSAVDKGTSLKSSTGGMALTGAPPQAGFGMGGFVGTGGSIDSTPTRQEYSLPSPQQTEQQEPKFKPITMDVKRPNGPDPGTKKPSTKNCHTCGSTIPSQSKYCSKCGNAQ
jgi:hypothetical protein